METKTIQEAAKELNLPTTGHEENFDWVLTPPEEAQVIRNTIANYAKGLPLIPGFPDNRIDRAKKHFTPEMLREALNVANINKNQDLWHKQQREKRIAAEYAKFDELQKKCNANYFYHLMKRNALPMLNGKPFLMQPIVKIVCFYFSRDARFESELNLDLNKGLWLRGLPGRGKTFPLYCVQENELIPFKIHSVISIANEVAENGSYVIKDFIKVIDDVGSEQATVNHYGTKINWVKEFIELYYADKRPFNQLIITTNLDFNEIETIYGTRVRSRVKEMFNIIDVFGNDLR